MAVRVIGVIDVAAVATGAVIVVIAVIVFELALVPLALNALTR